MDFLLDSTVNQALLWLIIAVVFTIIEALTLGLTTIWFAGGSIVALIASLLGANVWIQIALFLTVSILLLALTRKIFVKKLKTGEFSTNAMTLIGKRGKAISDIEFDGLGRVKLGAQEWSAVPEDENAVIKAGTDVEVLEIEGVKVIVRELKK